MDIDGIRTFVAIARLGSFTRAAAHLRRSQPAISRRMSLLEAEFGTPLLHRVQGRVLLTTAGQAFLPFAESALAALEDGREAVAGTAARPTGTVALAMVGTLADTYLVDLLRAFSQHSLGRHLDVRTATSDEVSDLVRRADVTLGLRYVGDKNPMLVSESVGVETLIVVGAADHPLLRRRKLRIADLAGERWVGFPLSRGRESFGQILHRQLSAVGIDPAGVVLIDSLTAQKRFVQAGFGIALMPSSAVRDELRSGAIVRLDVQAMQTSVPIALIYRRNGYLNAAAMMLIELIREAGVRHRHAPGRGGGVRGK